MREKLNENPMMQMLVIGVLIVLVGFIFVLRMRSGSEDTATPPADSAATTADPSATGAPATATDPAATGAAPAATDPAAAAATDPAAAAAAGTAIPSAAPATGTVAAFKAGPGLPKPVAKAYDDNKVVTLLVTKSRGADDRKLRRAVRSIRGRDDVALFEVRVENVDKYATITQGVDLDRVPALVVVQPKRLAKKGSAPTATVSYGFRDPASVRQAVDDQLYDGKTLGYSPG